VSSPLSKIPPRFQAPVKAALRALTAPADLKEDSTGAIEAAPSDGRDPLKDRLRRPMMIGLIVVLVFVVIAGVWASFSRIDGAVMAQAQVRAEYNRRTLRPREGGVVESIYVREGQKVARGQILLKFAPTVPQASVDVMRNQVDSALVQSARFEAELADLPAIRFSPELIERARTDPALAGMMGDQENVFRSRRLLVLEQQRGYAQQIEQLRARIGGLNLQIKANEDSANLIREQLKGYQTLYDKGFAPRTVLLNLQRTLSDMGGQRGANIAEVTRTQEQIGEVMVNLSKLKQQFQAEAAQGLSQSQVQLADAMPRLRAAEESLAGATVRSPTDGYVIGLTQFTPGAAVTASERLMDIVPANEPLIIEARVKPTDIDQAVVGQRARVLLTAYNSRLHTGVEGNVVRVSPDHIETEAGPYFRVDVRITPEALAASDNSDVKLTPGMPATVMLMTGKRSIMSYLLNPFVAPVERALREE
jgi:HlyD family secretion protein